MVTSTLQRGSPRRCPPLAAIDDVVVALAFDARFDVGGVDDATSPARSWQRPAELAFQQGLEPGLALMGLEP